MARQHLLLLGGLLMLGCSARRPVSVPLDAAQPPVPDAAQLERAPVEQCRPERRLLRGYADPAGNFTLAIAEAVQVSPVGIAGATPGQSAAALSVEAVAGLAATRPASGSGSLPLELASTQKAFAAELEAAGLGSLAQRASGALGRSHDGQPQLMGAVWDVVSTTSLGVGQARDRLLAAILQRPLSALSTPPAPGVDSQKLVVRVSVTQRGQQLGFAAAVLSREDDDDTASDRSIMAADLANGTGLAAAGAQTELSCDVGEISGQPKADIIWVMDESISMDDNRLDIVANANLFFKKALAANLDFRMGVTGVRRPDGFTQMGKFCSRDALQADDGGDDRFLSPGEQDVFSACINNPPYFEQSYEYGITNAYWAVKHHLPRADAPGRIRPGAKLAIIIATDEAAQELKTDGSFEGNPGFLDLADWHYCTLSEGKQAKVQSMLKPVFDLLSGVADPEAAASVHVLGGLCDSTCAELVPEVAHGYRELAEQLGGQLGDICQKSLGPTLQIIIDSIAASASPRVLHATPISASLEVELNGVTLPRSRRQGYDYDPLANALTFIGVKVNKGDNVTVGYRRFR